MPLVPRGFGRSVAFALFRNHMDQHRARRPRLDRAQNRQQLVQVMPVDRPKIRKTQLFKQRAADCHTFQHILGTLRAFTERAWQHAYRTLGGCFKFLERLFGI